MNNLTTNRLAYLFLALSYANDGMLFAQTFAKNPVNGHYYGIVNASVNWKQAAQMACELTCDGHSGYLVTISDQQESEFLLEEFGFDALNFKWTGGIQFDQSESSEDNWGWYTGETFSFQNWTLAEPTGPDFEDRILFAHGAENNGPGWSDISQATNSSGFVVEFGEIESASSNGFFWSDRNLNGGAANLNPEYVFPQKGIGTLYLYFDSLFSEIPEGASLNIETTNNGVIQFLNAETFDYDIFFIPDGSTTFFDRWGNLVNGSSGNTGDVQDEQILGLKAQRCLAIGTGMINQHTGPETIDEGYDIFSDAFLFAKVDFEVVGKSGDCTRLVTSVDGSIDDDAPNQPTFGGVCLTIQTDVVLGDVNSDGTVNLLDVAPFVNLISNGLFQAEADINQDGNVDLLDVGPFVELLIG